MLSREMIVSFLEMVLRKFDGLFPVNGAEKTEYSYIKE